MNGREIPICLKKYTGNRLPVLGSDAITYDLPCIEKRLKKYNTCRVRHNAKQC